MEQIQKERIQPGGDAATLYHIVYKHEGQIMGNPPVKFRYIVIYVAQVRGRGSILSPSLFCHVFYATLKCTSSQHHFFFKHE